MGNFFINLRVSLLRRYIRMFQRRMVKADIKFHAAVRKWHLTGDYRPVTKAIILYSHWQECVREFEVKLATAERIQQRATKSVAM